MNKLFSGIKGKRSREILEDQIMDLKARLLTTTTQAEYFNTVATQLRSELSEANNQCADLADNVKQKAEKIEALETQLKIQIKTNDDLKNWHHVILHAGDNVKIVVEKVKK